MSGTVYSALEKAMIVARNKAILATTQDEVTVATNALNSAVTAYNNAEKKYGLVDKYGLLKALDYMIPEYKNAIEGKIPGQYAIGSKAIFKGAIDVAQVVSYKINVTQAEVNAAIDALQKAESDFRSKIVNGPPILNTPYLTQHDVATTNGVILSWDKATDDKTPQSDLQYSLYMSRNKPDWNNMEIWKETAILVAIGNDMNSWMVNALDDNADYYFQLIVEDADGNKTQYATEHRAPRTSATVDKKALTDAISDAVGAATDLIVGQENGNYAQADIDIFQTAIADAQRVVGNANATLDEVGKAYEALKQAEDIFYKSEITGLQADMQSVPENENFDQTIQVKIEGYGDFIKTLSKDNITLGGDFTGLIINSVTVDPIDDYKVNIKLTGNLMKSTGIGTITINQYGWRESSNNVDRTCRINVGPASTNGSPVLVGNGILTQHDDETTPGSLTLTWDKATDDTTPQDQLKYYLYMKENKYYNTVEEWKLNSESLTEANNINSFKVTGLNDTSEYYFQLVVEDADGNKTKYTTEHRPPASAQVDQGFYYVPNLDSTHKIVTLTFNKNIINNTLSNDELKNLITISKSNSLEAYDALGASDTIEISGKVLKITFDQALPVGDNWIFVKLDKNGFKDETGNVWGTGSESTSDLNPNSSVYHGLSIIVKGIMAIRNYNDLNAYNVTLPNGTDLAKLTANDIEVGVGASSGISTIGGTKTSDGGKTWTVDVTAEGGPTVTYTINVTVGSEATVTIADVTVSKNNDSDIVNVGDELTLTVTMSDGQPAGDRVEYFAVVQESEESTDGIDIKVPADSNTMIIQETYTDNGTIQSIVGKYIDFGAGIKNASIARAAGRVGPIQNGAGGSGGSSAEATLIGRPANDSGVIDYLGGTNAFRYDIAQPTIGGAPSNIVTSLSNTTTSITWEGIQDSSIFKTGDNPKAVLTLTANPGYAFDTDTTQWSVADGVGDLRASGASRADIISVSSTQIQIEINYSPL